MRVRPELWILPVGLLLALGACTRDFEVPEGSLQLGQRCGSGGECSSAFCSDGVCCDARCGGVQLCNLPGSVGTCLDRPRGHGCDGGADCKDGFCSDGVCCDSACTDACHTCAAPGSAGSCVAAPDNTDAHHDCGSCAACFSGVCGQAFDGTDPKQECAAGLTCGFGACNPALGQPCDGVSLYCAVGFCTGWRCMDAAYTRMDDYPFLRTDQHRRPLGMASGPGGHTAVLVNSDDSPNVDGGYLGRVAVAVAPTPLGPWTAVNIEYTAAGRRHGAVAMTGDVAFFAVESDLPVEDNYDFGYSGIYGQEVQTTGLPGAASDPDLEGLNALQIAASSDALGRLTMATVADGGDLRVARRGTDGVWAGDAVVVARGASGVAACTANGEAQLLYNAGGQLLAVLADGSTEAAPGVAGCEGPLYAVTAPHPDGGSGDEVGLVVRCSGVDQLGLFRPGGTGAARWYFTPAPTETPYNGSFNPDDPTTFPIAKVRPAGGHEGIVFFNALEPGDAPGAPRGGFVQIFWMDQDGGLTYAAASNPDNGYKYVDYVTSASANGAPLAAYDTVVDVDGGVPVNNATLLLESYSSP